MPIRGPRPWPTRRPPIAATPDRARPPARVPRGRAEAARRAHATHYRAVAEAARSELGGAGQPAALARLAAEHANLRAAVGWALEADPPAAVATCNALVRFWHVRGHAREGRAWLDRALARAAAVAPAERAIALSNAGLLAWAAGDPEAAEARYREGLELERAHGSQRGVAVDLGMLGILALERGDPERAMVL